MGTFIEPTGCGESTTNAIAENGKLVKIPLQSGRNIYYNGPTLPGSGCKACMTLNEVIQRLDLEILDLKNRILQLENQ